MADPDRPLFADAAGQVSRLAADVRRMVGLHGQLARLELEASARRLRRLAMLLGAGAAMVLIGLPILGVWTAYVMPESVRPYFLLVLGAVLSCGGIGVLLAVWRAWCRFRTERFGLEETLEELREDLVWLDEWVGRDATQPGREP
jgi:uncharacterized membrane protein YqjE